MKTGVENSRIDSHLKDVLTVGLDGDLGVTRDFELAQSIAAFRSKCIFGFEVVPVAAADLVVKVFGI